MQKKKRRPFRWVRWVDIVTSRDGDEGGRRLLSVAVLHGGEKNPVQTRASPREVATMARRGLLLLVAAAATAAAAVDSNFADYTAPLQVVHEPADPTLAPSVAPVAGSPCTRPPGDSGSWTPEAVTTSRPRFRRRRGSISCER